jgi:hypothetical protein
MSIGPILSMALQPFAGPWPLFQSLNLHIVGRTPWTGDQPVVRPLSTHRRTQTQNKRTKKSMPWVGFETTTPVFERAKTARPLWSAAHRAYPPFLSNYECFFKHEMHLLWKPCSYCKVKGFSTSAKIMGVSMLKALVSCTTCFTVNHCLCITTFPFIHFTPPLL